MARRRRLFLEGVPLHVMFRGNNRQDIFRREGDRHFFRDALLDGTRHRGVSVHAYVFMTNHVHLLATPETKESLPGLFRVLGARYAPYFNRSLGRTGALWEDRFKSIFVHDGQYLLSCMRYIELNPVRAGMVASPGSYPWSSFRANANDREDELVTPHPTFLDLDHSPLGRAATYRSLFDPHEDEGVAVCIRKAIASSWAFGDEEFVKWTGMKSGRLKNDGDSPPLIIPPGDQD